MNHKFDELAKGLAQAVTRRQALRKLGLGMVGVFASWASLRGVSAAPGASKGKCLAFPTGIGTGKVDWHYTGGCINPATCQVVSSPDCPAGYGASSVTSNPCLASTSLVVGNKSCLF